MKRLGILFVIPFLQTGELLLVNISSGWPYSLLHLNFISVISSVPADLSHCFH